MKSKKLVKSIFANKMRLKVIVLGAFIFTTVFTFGAGNIPFVQATGIDVVTVTLADDTVSTASQVDVVFTPQTALVDTDVIKIYLGPDTGGDEWDMTGVLTTDVVCDDAGSEGTWTTNSVNAATASLPAYVQITATVADGGAITCNIGQANDPTNPAVASGYSIAVVTNDDAGAGVAYVGNHNDVTVTAAVLPLLTMDLDNADGSNCVETAGVIACNMGVLTTAAVTSGNYDINAFTNAASGLTVQINADAGLDDGGNDIDDVGESTVAAGTEDYGIAVAVDGGLTRSGNFATDDSSVPTSATDLYTAAAPVTSADATITHKVAISSSTAVGSYAQVVTYTAAGDF
ncbi:MAG: hypothetical protein ABIE68_01780 [bacterium]